MSNFKDTKIVKAIVTFYKNRSMSTQIISTIALIFLSFFALQWLLNDQFFRNYYAEAEFTAIHQNILDYVDDMNSPNVDHYDTMYDFTQGKNIYSVIISRDYRLQGSGVPEYSIEIEDNESQETHTFLIPDNSYNYTLGQSITIEAYSYTANIYSPVTITIPDEYLYDNGIQCNESDCIEVEGTITQINKPRNLNFQFENNSIVRQELNKFSSGTKELDNLNNDIQDEYWYLASNDDQSYLVFFHKLGTFDFILTIIPIDNTASIISIVNSYNNWVYVTAIVIMFIWSFRLSRTIADPVQDIENAAKEIANLNFNVEAGAYNNRENTSLSNSINLIAMNLKDTLNTLSGKNEELKELYDEQVKQVSLKKQLVSSISHELKTPLMIMQVTIQGILDGIIDKEDEEDELLNVLEEINKSAIMIGDMLQIYRLEDANTTLELSEFNVSQLVYFFIKDFENVLKKHNLKIDLNLDSEVVLEADMKLIKRCISNFFTNAIRYTPDEGLIYIEVSESDDKVYFELTNFGTTIPDDEIENIWIPFYRGQSTSINQKLKTKGSGVGLYLVSEVLKAHGAEYGITNVENGVKAYFRINKKATII